MCRGSLSDKAESFYELVGVTGAGFIESDNIRLKRAVKKLVFFSEIFPKKY